MLWRARAFVVSLFSVAALQAVTFSPSLVESSGILSNHFRVFYSSAKFLLFRKAKAFPGFFLPRPLISRGKTLATETPCVAFYDFCRQRAPILPYPASSPIHSFPI